MARHREWVFECTATNGEFARLLQAALTRAGYHVGDAKVFDFSLQGPGGRAYVKLAYHEVGIALLAKLKPSLIVGSAPRLERAILDAGRAAQTALHSATPRPRNP